MKLKNIMRSLLSIGFVIACCIAAFDARAQVSDNWGKVDTDYDFLFNTTSVSCSGISPDLNGMQITGIRIYGQIPSGSANMRMAVYTGGTADNDPTGATLLWDAGETIVDASSGLHWIEITHPSGGVDWPANTRTWLCWKDASSTIVYANETDPAAPPGAAEVVGNFNPNVGRHTNTISTDPAAVFPSTYPAGGTFNNQYWYMINVSYTTEDTETNCSDGIDNDSDGDADCLDVDCDGRGCDDADACTTGETCSGSVCTGGSSINCDDSNPCTDNSCNPEVGCVYTNNSNPCDDGLFCNGADTCNEGICTHAGDPCAPDQCDEENDQCIELIDSDADGVPDISDNCPLTPNGPDLGTCVMGTISGTCLINEDCGQNGFCSLNQDDSYPPGGNGFGDACECEGNFDGDYDVDGTDAFIFKQDFGRSILINPCPNRTLP